MYRAPYRSKSRKRLFTLMIFKKQKQSAVASSSDRSQYDSYSICTIEIACSCSVCTTHGDLFFWLPEPCSLKPHTSQPASSGRGQICSSADPIKYDAEISSKLSGNHLPAINDQHSLSVTFIVGLDLTKIQFEIPYT